MHSIPSSCETLKQPFCRSLAALAILALALLTQCGGSGGKDGAKLTLTGSSTLAPLAMDIAKRFEDAHPGVRIDVQTGGSSRGIADVRSGLAEIGMASRSLKTDESDLTAHRLARDGVCLIAHQDNPVASLTDAQVVAIYTGKARNWKEVGGADRLIVVANKAEGRATLEVFLEYFKIEAGAIRADVIVGENQHAIKTVEGNPDAVAYVSIGTAACEAANGVPVRLMGMNGIEPTNAHVADGSFPVARPLNLVTKDAPTGLAKEFLDYALSDKVHDLVEKHHFIPVE